MAQRLVCALTLLFGAVSAVVDVDLLRVCACPAFDFILDAVEKPLGSRSAGAVMLVGAEDSGIQHVAALIRQAEPDTLSLHLPWAVQGGSLTPEALLHLHNHAEVLKDHRGRRLVLVTGVESISAGNATALNALMLLQQPQIDTAKGTIDMSATALLMLYDATGAADGAALRGGGLEPREWLRAQWQAVAEAYKMQMQAVHAAGGSALAASSSVVQAQRPVDPGPLIGRFAAIVNLDALADGSGSGSGSGDTWLSKLEEDPACKGFPGLHMGMGAPSTDIARLFLSFGRGIGWLVALLERPVLIGGGLLLALPALWLACGCGGAMAQRAPTQPQPVPRPAAQAVKLAAPAPAPPAPTVAARVPTRTNSREEERQKQKQKQKQSDGPADNDAIDLVSDDEEGEEEVVGSAAQRPGAARRRATPQQQQHPQSAAASAATSPADTTGAYHVPARSSSKSTPTPAARKRSSSVSGRQAEAEEAVTAGWR